MKNIKSIASKLYTTRIGFFLLAVILFWFKTYAMYKTKFSLGEKGLVQELLLFFNPLAFTLFIFAFALFAKGKKSYIILLILDFVLSTWLFSNIVYYREFSDFITVSIMKSFSSVSNNMGSSAFALMKPTDLLAYADVVVLVVLLAFKKIKLDKKPVKKRVTLSILALAVLIFTVNLSTAEADRPQLLSRTFDRNYIIKYLGLNVYVVYDGIKTEQTNLVKAKADSNDLNSVLDYVKSNQTSKNVEYYGKAQGKNVFVIHLESFQQFLIDYKVDGQEVTPTLNKFYHDSNTVSFDNFFHQVAQGKTSDAETMLETSLFGLPQGSAMVTAGTDNTFQAAPALLNQKGYTTAAFHGDVGTFWNRNNAYKSWGYDYFFDSSYYPSNESYELNYGLKDKIFLKESAQYIEQLPQPFYAKLITVTNHYPYPLDSQNASFPKTTTGDSTVDGYVQTAHYLDQAINEFLTYLKQTGLYDNSVIMMYGDHYGISSNHSDAIKQLLNKNDFTKYDDAMFQKVPFMIHAPGIKGGVNHTYGGEIDVLPTLLSLLGVDHSNNIFIGSDLLSEDHKQIVSFRNGDFVAKDFTKVGSKIFNTSTGEEILELTTEQQATIKAETKYVQIQLDTSDQVINGDLLRFYTLPDFKTVNKSDYSYVKSKAIKKLKSTKKGTSLLEKLGKSTVDEYKTDAPELNDTSDSSSSSTSTSANN
ncbi:glycerol phosphate lipoteichoic acid synthase [Vagococcus entomophilus]|uniref:Glycerol phosphate lipoteichoic acid synthase n=1 Tax=Vagococcus entomophilus TaxID=1160095 RepID=A0A430AJ64_9ENTE|nr:glycerol phosphate lipoteichoic acid synthase [Vagococcus entomophilus]